jgi:magnesium-transporting ATPase (P-type)
MLIAIGSLENEMNCMLSNAMQALSLKLHVNREQIQKCLLWAPLYTCLICFGCVYILILISSNFDFKSSLEILFIFTAYSAVILITYYVLTCIFIYMAQLWLMKRRKLNFWWIMLSAIMLSCIFILMVLLLGPSMLGMIPATPIVATPIALCYWLLLLRQHQKNTKKSG